VYCFTKIPGNTKGFSIIGKKTRICTFPIFFSVESARLGGAAFEVLTGTREDMFEDPFA
jgi:hypothetical protein